MNRLRPRYRSIRMLALIGAVVAFSMAVSIQLRAVDTDTATEPSVGVAESQDTGSPEYKKVAVSILSRASNAAAQGNIEEARRLARDAAKIQVQWTDDELTPDQLLGQLAARESESDGQSSFVSTGLHSPEYARLARDLLREARDFLNHGDFDEAEELAAAAQRLEIEWWKGEQTPAKLISEIRKARRFQSSSQIGGRGQRNQGFVYVAGAEDEEPIAPVIAGSPESHTTADWRTTATEASAIERTSGTSPTPQLMLPLPEADHTSSRNAVESEFVSAVKVVSKPPVDSFNDFPPGELALTEATSEDFHESLDDSGADAYPRSADREIHDLSVFKVAVSELSSAVRELRQSVHESRSPSDGQSGDEQPVAMPTDTAVQNVQRSTVDQPWPSTVAPAAVPSPRFADTQMVSPYPPIIIQNYPSTVGGQPAQWQTSYYVPSGPAPNTAPAMTPGGPVVVQPTSSSSSSAVPWIICGLLLICVVLFGRRIDDARVSAIAWINSRSESAGPAASSRQRSRVSDSDDDIEEQNPRAMILSVLDQNMDLREKLSA
jgi:hypothetical protein